ncbi:unnamed protein product [Amoebophrya sp. A120]|nr:unnamed protein product [Amoebophrya sp. A120]|eukprot:GSA120T00022450001.1
MTSSASSCSVRRSLLRHRSSRRGPQLHYPDPANMQHGLMMFPHTLLPPACGLFPCPSYAYRTFVTTTNAAAGGASPGGSSSSSSSGLDIKRATRLPYRGLLSQTETSSTAGRAARPNEQMVLSNRPKNFLQSSPVFVQHENAFGNPAQAKVLRHFATENNNPSDKTLTANPSKSSTSTYIPDTRGIDPLKQPKPPFPFFDFSVPWQTRAQQVFRGSLYVFSSIVFGGILGFYLSNSEKKKQQILADLKSGKMFWELVGFRMKNVDSEGNIIPDVEEDNFLTDEEEFEDEESVELRKVLALNLITDEVFDNSDNLFVIVASSDRQLHDPVFKKHIRKLQKMVIEHCTNQEKHAGSFTPANEIIYAQSGRGSVDYNMTPGTITTRVRADADGVDPESRPLIGSQIIGIPDMPKTDEDLEKMPHQKLKPGKIRNSLPKEIKFYYTIQENLAVDAHTTVKFMTYRGHRKGKFEFNLSNPAAVAEGKTDEQKSDDNSGTTTSTSSSNSSTSSLEELKRRKMAARAAEKDLLIEMKEFVQTTVKPFYEFVSQEDFVIKEKGIQTISAAQFEQFVMEDSHEYPVVLQMYEETCFLCFLMRPMMESLARLQEFAFLDPVRFLRINVEQNDFPPGLPMARGTPQFLLYKEGKGVKWDEFKPQDFVTKLIYEFQIEDVEQVEKLKILAETVQRRFQLFTAVAMWQLELRKLEEELSASAELMATGGENSAAAPEPDKEWLNRALPAAGSGGGDDGFSQVIAALMAADMKRTDTLDQNLKVLEKEAEELEKDVSLLGVMLGKAVEKGEKDQGRSGAGPEAGKSSSCADKKDGDTTRGAQTKDEPSKSGEERKHDIRGAAAATSAQDDVVAPASGRTTPPASAPDPSAPRAAGQPSMAAPSKKSTRRKSASTREEDDNISKMMNHNCITENDDSNIFPHTEECNFSSEQHQSASSRGAAGENKNVENKAKSRSFWRQRSAGATTTSNGRQQDGAVGGGGDTTAVRVGNTTPKRKNTHYDGAAADEPQVVEHEDPSRGSPSARVAVGSSLISDLPTPSKSKKGGA